MKIGVIVLSLFPRWRHHATFASLVFKSAEKILLGCFAQTIPEKSFYTSVRSKMIDWRNDTFFLKLAWFAQNI